MFRVKFVEHADSLRKVVPFIPLIVLLLSGCKLGNESAHSQVLATVNAEEITVNEVDQYLQNHTFDTSNVQSAQQQAIDAVIDQHLLQNAARAAKIDRQPDVMLDLLQARKETLIKDYADALTPATAPAPTQQQIVDRYQTNPLLYGDRRLYWVKQWMVQADTQRQQYLLQRMKQAHNTTELEQIVTTSGYPYSVIESAFEPISLTTKQLNTLANMQQGGVFIQPANPDALTFWELERIDSQPLSLHDAQLEIAHQLNQQKGQTQMQRKLAQLRSQAKIVYFSK